MWFNVRMDKCKEMSINYSNKHGELKKKKGRYRK